MEKIEDMIAEHVQRERENMRSRPRLTSWMDALLGFIVIVLVISFIRALHG